MNIPLESVTFCHPAKVGASMVTGASVSTSSGAPCSLALNVEDRMVLVVHLPSKRETLVPVSNVSSMVPLKVAVTPSKK